MIRGLSETQWHSLRAILRTTRAGASAPPKQPSHTPDPVTASILLRSMTSTRRGSASRPLLAEGPVPLRPPSSQRPPRELRLSEGATGGGEAVTRTDFPHIASCYRIEAPKHFQRGVAGGRDYYIYEVAPDDEADFDEMSERIVETILSLVRFRPCLIFRRIPSLTERQVTSLYGRVDRRLHRAHDLPDYHVILLTGDVQIQVRGGKGGRVRWHESPRDVQLLHHEERGEVQRFLADPSLSKKEVPPYPPPSVLIQGAMGGRGAAYLTGRLEIDRPLADQIVRGDFRKVDPVTFLRLGGVLPGLEIQPLAAQVMPDLLDWFPTAVPLGYLEIESWADLQATFKADLSSLPTPWTLSQVRTHLHQRKLRPPPELIWLRLHPHVAFLFDLYETDEKIRLQYRSTDLIQELRQLLQSPEGYVPFRHPRSGGGKK